MKLCSSPGRFFILLLIVGVLFLPGAGCEENVYKIGILSQRGAEQSLNRWAGTAEYLSATVPNSTFEIVPMNYEEITYSVANDEVDFVLTDPLMYVELESSYGINRIATLKNTWHGGVYTEYGSVILTRSDRGDINELEDIKGKSVMAVNEHSLGGFWIAVRTSGVDYNKDFSDLTFGNTHDTVVYAVRDRDVDVGIIRTDILERMEAEGSINLSDFKVINSQQVEGFPFLLSTDLYPEWAFSRTESTSLNLAEEVTIALLSMPVEDRQTQYGNNYAGWTIPLDYEPVQDLMRDLRLGPYKDYGKIPLSEAIAQHWYLFALMLLLVGLVITYDRLTTEKVKKLELERSNNLKDLFTDIMRHDLLNPAGAIRGFNEILYSQENDGEKKRILEIIGRQADKLIAMIDSAAQLAKLESSDELKLGEKDVGQLIRSVADSFAHELAEKNMTLDMVEGGPYPSQVNEVIEDVFANLISNAIKYSPEGSAIKIKVLDAEDYWKTEVIDNGDGISDENKPLVFDRFKRVDRKGIKGSGLGLAIVKRIVDLHGGSVGVEDNPEGQGSVFWVSLKKA
ncbi:MAG: sensor histidine kinase [Methanolobus sp.]|nr:sensor histidine kinase [Methanolobus sp.]